MESAGSRYLSGCNTLGCGPGGTLPSGHTGITSRWADAAARLLRLGGHGTGGRTTARVSGSASAGYSRRMPVPLPPRRLLTRSRLRRPYVGAAWHRATQRLVLVWPTLVQVTSPGLLSSLLLRLPGPPRLPALTRLSADSSSPRSPADPDPFVARRHCDTGVRARRPRPFRFSWSVAPHSFKFAAAGPWPARAGAGPGLSRAAGVPCRASHVLRPFRQEHHDASRNGPGPSLYCARSLPAAQARSLPARRSMSVAVPARAAAAASLMVTTERHNICDGDSDRALSGAGRGQQSSIATLTAISETPRVLLQAITCIT